MKKIPRKRRTREHVIADLSVNHVERHALLCGFVVERSARDYGIDLEVYTFTDKGDAEEGVILLQLKASDRLRVKTQQPTFAFRVERRDLALWLAQPMPVILVVYDAPMDVAYWVYVQSYFRRQKGFNLFAAGKTVTVHVPLANVINTAAVRRFARIRDRVLEQLEEVFHDEDEAHPLLGVSPFPQEAGICREAVGDGVDLPPPPGRAAGFPPVRRGRASGRTRPANYAEVSGHVGPAGRGGLRRVPAGGVQTGVI
jgi:hypothetical protein